ncbi:hypothetical protein PsorP6_015186 [Peronosclerospora sorghi]|uniref:Uncharacterized protein n=1 Tax=Peronosclerospora sorghi TaxID=230839 RepID=A0ACC0VV13_9STRA|nr:hypothetical protein PsorP6_015186 [Peronosclerospora sorghi]
MNARLVQDRALGSRRASRCRMSDSCGFVPFASSTNARADTQPTFVGILIELSSPTSNVKVGYLRQSAIDKGSQHGH